MLFTGKIQIPLLLKFGEYLIGHRPFALGLLPVFERRERDGTVWFFRPIKTLLDTGDLGNPLLRYVLDGNEAVEYAALAERQA